MDTLEATSTPSMAATAVSTESRTNRWVFGGIVVVAAALGLVAGLLVVGGDDDPTSVVVAGGGELTPRQEQMVEIVEGYVAGWQATDGDAVAAFMTADGYIEYPSEGWMFGVDDGALQDRVTHEVYGTLDLLDPMLVYDDRVVITGTIGAMGARWVSIIRSRIRVNSWSRARPSTTGRCEDVSAGTRIG